MEKVSERASRYRSCLVEVEKRARESSEAIALLLNRLNAGQMPKPNELRAAIDAYKWGMYSVAVRIQGELAYDNIAGLPEVPDDDGSTWIAKQGGTTPTVTLPDAYLNGAASFDQWLKGEDELSKGGEG